jgi:hypothetical protein
MSARGGQWIAVGALVIVGLGIIIYLSRKQRKKPANLPSKFDNFCVIVSFNNELDLERSGPVKILRTTFDCLVVCLVVQMQGCHDC